ncbi:MAG: sulfotransferase, partial [Pseudomonadota bacterium]
MRQRTVDSPDTSGREPNLKEIRLSNIHSWIRQTVRNDRSQRPPSDRPLTATTLLRMLRPNLREPVFAIGSPRSGTTFLGECLSQLPEISYHYEPVITKAAVRCVWTGAWSERFATAVYRTVFAWLMRIEYEPDLRFCEKTPGNCFILPFLHRAFPDAKFIHIVRDGRDAALSLSKKPWYRNDSRDSGERDPDGYLLGPSRRFWVEHERADEYERTGDLHRCIWLWRRYVEEALRGKSSIPDAQYYELRYEDLVAEPGKYATDIGEFLGIESSSSKARFRDGVVANARA